MDPVQPADLAEQGVNAAIRIPDYWPSDPLLWFLQVEAQFTAKGITRELTKYGHVAGQLPPSIATEVRDIIINPGPNPYSTLRTAIIQRTAESRKQRLRKLLIAEELGDRKPTQLLRRMEQLLGGAALDNQPLCHEIFLNRLPQHVRAVLASLDDDVTIQRQAEIADKVMEASGYMTTAAVQATPSTSMAEELSAIKAQMAVLTVQMERLSHQEPHRRNSSRTRSRSRSRPRTQGQSGLCFYHFKFGSNARNCQAPCNYHQENATGSA